jgi:3-dehydroquinate synthetase
MRTEIAQAVPADVDADQLMAAMMQDKKNEDGKLVLILSEGIGKAFVRKDVDVGLVHQFWREALTTVPPASKKD